MQCVYLEKQGSHFSYLLLSALYQLSRYKYIEIISLCSFNGYSNKNHLPTILTLESEYCEIHKLMMNIYIKKSLISISTL